MRANPHARESHSAAACGSFKSFLHHAHQPSCTRIPQRGSVWIVQVLSTKTRTNLHARESHSAAACGSFKPFLQRRAPTFMHANPTARQRVDRSSPLYKDAHQPSCTRIPQRGSVWIVQILSLSNAVFSSSAFCAKKVGRSSIKKDLKDPHAAAVWDSRSPG